MSVISAAKLFIWIRRFRENISAADADKAPPHTCQDCGKEKNVIKFVYTKSGKRSSRGMRGSRCEMVVKAHCSG
jgi:hypothetical protein